MARDADALRLLTKWASTGDVQTPEDAGLARAAGWPSSYEQNGGDKVSRRVFNQIFRELSGLAVEINRRGILEWDTAIDYVHPAAVLGTNATVYISTADSGPNSGGSVDPEGSTGGTRWASLTPDGSTTARGMLELATSAEATAGADTARAVNAAGVRAAGDARWRRQVQSVTTDCNSLTTAGQYRIHSNANANAPPSVSTAFILEVLADGNRIRQDAWTLGSTAIDRAWLWTRDSTNGGTTWRAWADRVRGANAVVYDTSTWTEDDFYDWTSPFLSHVGAYRVLSGGINFISDGPTGMHVASHLWRETAQRVVFRGMSLTGNRALATAVSGVSTNFCTHRSLAI